MINAQSVIVKTRRKRPKSGNNQPSIGSSRTPSSDLVFDDQLQFPSPGYQSPTAESVVSEPLENERRESPGFIEDPPEASDSGESVSSAVVRQQRAEADPKMKAHNDEARMEIEEFNKQCREIVYHILEGKSVQKLYMIYLEKEESQRWV